ncbi:transglycosylase domain-containing protein [Allorhizocola rhizosphaerae]|uniref:transglycosylase domain-containing protein n=1 Tax=Allorhizocola rhizosphaerae TaxID=1872709 RepID=UPI0013C34011|nr:transglycosylase domain-containing protein [Allorhizocola rhizosphaerae]
MVNLIGKLSQLLLCAILSGAVLAAAIFPVLAATGLMAKAGGETFAHLPDELTVKRSPQNTYVYASDNKTLIAVMFDENRSDLPLSDIPVMVQQAILAAEDQKFYDHNGVDTKAMARAFITNQTSGEVQQGASTLTMQLVRMSLTYSLDNTPQGVIEATENTNRRKLLEVNYALALERRMSKEDILEKYLNTAYFGSRAYGIFAASQVYFGKHPKDLTVAQAAFLAGLVKFPGKLDKASGRQEAVTRRNYVIGEMVQMGHLTAEQGAEARAEELKISDAKTPNGCVQVLTNHWGFFCDYFHRWWLKQEVFGGTDYDRERQLRSGGFRIQTTLDVNAQQAAFDNATKYAPIGEPQALMLSAIEPGSGKVRALAVNRHFKLDTKGENGQHTNPAAAPGTKGTYPNTTNPLLSTDPSFQGYRPGSVMKMFTLIAALENGLPLDYVINTQAQAVSKYPYKKDPNCGGMWCPPNSSSSTPIGPHNMWSGFGLSVNTYFVPLFDIVGGDKVMDTARRMGITFYNDPGTEDDDFASSTQSARIWSPFTLGISTHPPLQIANAFATLAADGLYCEPTPIEAVFNNRGEQLAVGAPKCNQAIDREVARAAIDAGRCPVGDRGGLGKCTGGTASDSRGIIGKPIFGKTGTSDNESTATLTIATKQLAMSGFLVDPDWPDTTQKMKHKGDRGINPAVQHALAAAVRDLPDVQFPAPKTSRLITGPQAAIPDVTCKPIPEAQAMIKGAGFKAEVESRRPVPSPCPAGTAAGTSPTGKTLRNGVVVIHVSSGVPG